MVASEVQSAQLSCTKPGIKFQSENDDLPPMDPAKYLFSVSKITDELYLCGACALRADTFEKLGVTCVINCTTRDELPDTPIADGITYLRIPVRDSTMTNLSQYFHTVTDTIKNASIQGGRVLVHCIAGVSRSASICLAYLLKYHNMSLREAYQHVERQRPCINPNNSFFKQLIEFEIEIHGICSISMILDDATKSYFPDIYQCKFEDRLCCKLKLCQRRHYGTH